MQNTPLGLNKPELTDVADLILFIADNMDKLDTLLEARAKLAGDKFTGVVRVPKIIITDSTGVDKFELVYNATTNNLEFKYIGV